MEEKIREKLNSLLEQLESLEKSGLDLVKNQTELYFKSLMTELETTKSMLKKQIEEYKELLGEKVEE